MQKLQARELPGWTILRKFHAANYRRFTVQGEPEATQRNSTRYISGGLSLRWVNSLRRTHLYLVCTIS